MAERLRLFVAVRFELEQELTRLIEKARRRLDRRATIKWVEAHNVHLTLQFLGDVDAGLVPKLAGGLRGAFTDVAPFEAELAGLGAFPAPERARVIWAGVARGADGLRSLHGRTLRVTEPFGFPPEDRPFSPHLTLGRVKAGGRGADLAAPLAELSAEAVGRCQIREVVLVRSELRPNGPAYTALDNAPLGS